MAWWQWILLWLLLGVLGSAYVGWRIWRLWAPLKKLGEEVVLAQERLTEIEARIEELEEQLTSVDDLAVLRDPAELRAIRSDVKARSRVERSARRKARRRDWADHVDW